MIKFIERERHLYTFVYLKIFIYSIIRLLLPPHGSNFAMFLLDFLFCNDAAGEEEATLNSRAATVFRRIMHGQFFC